ncbi:MAG: flagellar type III secretion system pore protein FliP [Phycisphaerales bacterium]
MSRFLCRLLGALAVCALLGAGAPAVAQSPALPTASPTNAAALDVNPISLLADVGSLADRSRETDFPSGTYGPPSLALPGSSSQSGRTGGLSTAINIVVLITVIGLVPSIMLMTTCFVRIIIVLGLLRQAMGTNSLPPPQVILALSLFMTLLVMGPTLERIHAEAIVPYRSGEISDYDTLWNKAKTPMKDFMLDQIEHTGNWSSLYLMMQRRGVDISRPDELTRDDVDMVALIPAYMLSELRTAFLMGFRVYLPFLVIDMVIAALLISMNMMMLPPVLISLPFKLLLFVLVDGWQLVVGSLLDGFVTASPALASVPAPGG